MKFDLDLYKKELFIFRKLSTELILLCVTKGELDSKSLIVHESFVKEQWDNSEITITFSIDLVKDTIRGLDMKVEKVSKKGRVYSEVRITMGDMSIIRNELENIKNNPEKLLYTYYLLLVD